MRSDVNAQVAVREEILGQLRKVLIDRMRLRRAPAEIDPDAALFGAGFGLDSLDAVELIVCLDTIFGIKLQDQALLRQQMRSLNTIIDLVVAHRRGEAGAGGPHVARG